MRLTECYIEKFGKLTAKKISFAPGVNSFVYENGYGKTTLTAFIRAMLYGMSDSKRGDLYENERKHYLPWSGGAAGGWLAFCVGDKEYRVERSFGTKPSQDSFAIYELSTGKPTADFTENLGKELFGIDKDGFERTVFLSERNLSGETDNKTISEKLGNLSDADGDVGAMDGALKLLEDRRKFYYKKGGGGEIYETERKLKEARRELDLLSEKRDALARERERLSVLEAKLSAIAEAKTEAENINRAQLRRTEKEMLKKYCSERAAEKAAAGEELKKIDEFFAAGIPTHEELSDIAYKLSGAASAKEEPCAKEELLSLEAQLSGVDKEKIERAKAATNAIGGCKCKKLRIAVISASVLVAIGAILSFFVPIAGIAVSAAGVLIAAVFACIANKSRQSKRENAKKLALELGIKESDDIAQELARLEMKLKERDRLKEELALAKRVYAEASIEKERQRAEAESFLSKYPTSTDSPIVEIRTKLRERESLLSKISLLEAELAKYAVASEDGEAPVPEITNGLFDLIDSEGSVIAELKMTERKIRDTEEELDAEDSLTAECEILSERLDTYKRNLETVISAKGFLESARDNLTAKYLGKTKEAFLKYAAAAGDSGDFSLDTSFKLTKYEDGATRDAEAFSEGTKNSFYLSVRLALVDALYEGETPFLIFDDPFASYDDRRLLAAKEILRTLGEGRQILYFTPSGARAL